MTDLSKTLLSGVAALALLSAPAFAQDDPGLDLDLDLEGGVSTPALEDMTDSARDLLEDTTDEVIDSVEDAADALGSSGDASLGLGLEAIADTPVGELAGSSVVTAEGTQIGSIDHFAHVDGQIVAVLRISGEDGAERHVAVSINSLSAAEDGSFTLTGEAEISALPDHESDIATMIEADSTLSAEVGR